MNSPLTRTNARLIAAAVVAVLLGGGGAAGALVLTRQEEDTTPATAASLLADGRRAVNDVAVDLASVESLADVRSAARAAADASRRAEELVERAERALAANPMLAKPVQDALTADTAALTAVAQAADLQPQRLAGWKPMLADIRRAAADLSARHRSLRTSPLPARPGDPGPPLAEAATDADVLIAGAQRKLAGWQRRYRKAKQAKRRDLAILDGYQSSMSGYLRTYDDVRTEMSDWMGMVDTAGVSFDEAYEFLATASADRARVRRGIATLDAPAALAARHNTLLAIVDAGIAAVDRAYDGTVTVEFDFSDEYADYREAPGWQAFTAQSEQVAGRYGKARGEWDKTLAAQRKTIHDRAMPKVPDV